MTFQPTEPDVLSAAIETALRKVHTILPASIVTYTAPTQTATVQVEAKLEVTSGVWKDLPVIPDVPILCSAVHRPLIPGDGIVLLLFEQDPAPYLTGNPLLANKRRHGFYPVGIHGLRPTTSPLAGAVATATTIHGPGTPLVAVDAAGVRLGSVTAVDPIVLESKIKVAMAAMLSQAAANPACIVPPGGSSVAAVFTAMAASFAGAAISAAKASAE